MCSKYQLTPRPNDGSENSPVPPDGSAIDSVIQSKDRRLREDIDNKLVIFFVRVRGGQPRTECGASDC